MSDLDELGKEGGEDSREYAVRLRGIRDRLLEAKTKIMQEKRKPVHQSSMAEGSVELF